MDPAMPNANSGIGPAVLLWIQRIVKDWEVFALPHCNRRGEVIAERLGMRVIAKRNDELVEPGGHAEGEGVDAGELIAARGNFCLRLQPGD